MDRQPPATPRPERRPAGRHVLYTSGTEGKPKPVPRSRFASAGQIGSLLSSIPIPADTTILCAAPLFHAWGLMHMRLALARGGRLVLPLYVDPYELTELVRTHRPHTIVTIPVVLRGMVEALSRLAPFTPEVLAELQVIAVSGSALPGDLAERAAGFFGPRIYSLYGSTEAGWISVATPADLSVYPDTAGRPIRDVTVRISDASGAACGAGVPGRISVLSGFSALDTAIDTGDIGYLDQEGRLFVRGRADEMITIGGENVYPAEIERPLLEHPDVADAMVVPRRDDHYGHRVLALVVPKPGSSVTSKSLLEWLRPRVPVYALPQTIRFVDKVPRNATGKVLRDANDLR